MLFWIFVIALVIGIVCWIVGDLMYLHTEYDTEWLATIGKSFSVPFTVVIVLSCLAFALNGISADGELAGKKQTYESLTYQLENHLYEDSLLMEKELYDETQEWNENLAYRKALLDNFWVGIYFPDWWDQLEFIELPKGE